MKYYQKDSNVNKSTSKGIVNRQSIVLKQIICTANGVSCPYFSLNNATLIAVGAETKMRWTTLISYNDSGISNNPGRHDNGSKISLYITGFRIERIFL